MQRLLIVGAGAFGREVWEWAHASAGCGTLWQPVGFLDDNLSALDGFAHPAPIVGRIADHQPAPDEVFVCAIGSPLAKRRVIQSLSARGARWVTLVHERALVAPRTRLGEGCIVCPGTVVSCDVELGAHSTLNLLCTVGHDVRTGPYCQLSAHCDLTGGVVLGEAVFLGTHACILPKVEVGAEAVVGAGAVVVKRVAPGLTVAGVPARPL